MHWRGVTYMHIYTVSQEERSISILGGHSIKNSKQKVYMYMRPIVNGF
jgi:hypothetical protein